MEQPATLKTSRPRRRLWRVFTALMLVAVTVAGYWGWQRPDDLKTVVVSLSSRASRNSGASRRRCPIRYPNPCHDRRARRLRRRLPLEPQPVPASARLLERPHILPHAGHAQRHSSPAGHGGRLRGALSLGRGHVAPRWGCLISGSSRSTRSASSSARCARRSRPAGAGRRRHRLRRGAERDAHGAGLRGGGRRRRPP